MEDDNLHTF